MRGFIAWSVRFPQVTPLKSPLGKGGTKEGERDAAALGDGHDLVKVSALPYGRASEHAEAHQSSHISSLRVSKGYSSTQ